MLTNISTVAGLISAAMAIEQQIYERIEAGSRPQEVVQVPRFESKNFERFRDYLRAYRARQTNVETQIF